MIVRTSVENAAELMKDEYITVFDITGRPMKGWVMVTADIWENEDQLIELLKTGGAFAGTLPGK